MLILLVSQSCAVAKNENSGGPLGIQPWLTNGWPQQKLPNFGFLTHTTALWSVEKPTILSAHVACGM